MTTRALGLALSAATIGGAGIALAGVTGASVATVPSGDQFPHFVYTSTNASVAIRGGLVAVLNAGGAANVAGFRVSGSGLAPVAGGSQPLSKGGGGPEDVTISPDSAHVVATEKVSNTIGTFAVTDGGLLGPAVTSPSDSPLAFASVFTPGGQLLVADDGAAGTSAVSSYRVRADGTRRRHPGAGV
jgi:hypothetical protein